MRNWLPAEDTVARSCNPRHSVTCLRIMVGLHSLPLALSPTAMPQYKLCRDQCAPPAGICHAAVHAHPSIMP